MGNYSKLLGSLIGSGVGIVAAWLATKVPMIASCTGLGAERTCEVLGMSQMEITAALTLGFSALLTWLFPANSSS